MDSSTGTYSSSSSSSESSHKSLKLIHHTKGKPKVAPPKVSLQSKMDVQPVEISERSVNSNKNIKSSVPKTQEPLRQNSNSNLKNQNIQPLENQPTRQNSNSNLDEQIPQKSQSQVNQPLQPNSNSNWKNRQLQMQPQQPQLLHIGLFQTQSEMRRKMPGYNSNRQIQQQSRQESEQQSRQPNNFGSNSEMQQSLQPRINQHHFGLNLFNGPIHRRRPAPPMQRHLFRQNSNNDSSELFHQHRNRRNRPHIFRHPKSSHYSISQSLVDSSSISRKINQPRKNSFNNNAPSLNFNRPMFSGSSEKSSFAKINGFGSY